MAELRGGSRVGGTMILGKSGTNNFIPKFGASYLLSDSLIYDNGTNIGIGTITPTAKLEINGSFKATTATFTGAITGVTAAADTNTTQVATTAFVIGQASSTTPAANGTAAVGTSLKYARADHVHASDTSKAPLNSPIFTGTPTAPTAVAGTNTLQIATTAFVYNAVTNINSSNVYDNGYGMPLNDIVDDLYGSMGDKVSMTTPIVRSTMTINPTTTVNVGIELGKQTGATTPFIDFHSGATNVDYDTRLMASGGSGAVGGGTLTFEGSYFSVNGRGNFNTTNGRLIVPVGTNKYAT